MSSNFSVNACEALGTVNTVLCATTRSYHVPSFEGPLSIKAVLSGSAVVSIDNRALTARDNSFIVVNERQPYSFTIDSAKPTTMFCLFFAPGFVEDIWRTTITPTAELLDNWNAEGSRLKPRHFERIEVRTASILLRLRQLRRFIATNTLTRAQWDECFIRVATELVQSEAQVRRQIGRIPARKTSTKIELGRRLLRGRDFILSFAHQPLRLENVARHACLSPYHFHRAFAQFFGTTPHRFLIDYRLSRVASALRHSERSATELCFEKRL